MQSIKNSITSIAFCLLLFSSCNYLKNEEKKTAIAKVYDKILYFEDLNPQIYKNKSKEDSIQSVQLFIEKWAYDNLIVKEAEKNIDTSKINILIEQYKIDLLKETYLNKLIDKYLDTVVHTDTLKTHFNRLKELYKATRPMVKAKFLILNKKNKNKYKYQKLFFSDKPTSQDMLFKSSKEFLKMDLSGQKWMTIETLRKIIPPLKHFRDIQILKKSKKFVLTDRLHLYLTFINDSFKKGDELPFELVKENIKQIILNKRKEKLAENLKNEIKEEAIKNKNFKIFELNNK